jgi:hypothetical protein
MPSPTIDPVNGWGIGGFGDAFFGGIATKTIDADTGVLQLVGSDAVLNVLRNLLAFNLNSTAFLINGFNSRAVLEVDMFTQSPISEQDKQDIANAIINATKTIPIEAKIVEQTVAVTSQIAEAVVNDPKTLTTAKFLGLK